MSKLKTNHLLIFFGILIIILFLVRFLSPINSWVCKNGEWVEYGKSDVEKPDSKCEVK